MGEVNMLNAAGPQSPSRPMRRWLLGVVTAVALVAAGFGGNFLWRHIALYNAQRACLTYTAPPTDVVFETDNAAATALFATHHDSLGFFGPEGNAHFGAVPSCWWRFEAHILPSERARWGEMAVVFLHERVSRGPRGGHKRLVEVVHDCTIERNAEQVENTTSLVPLYSNEVWEAASLLSEPRRIDGEPRPSQTRLPQWANIALPTRIYAGQPDPADPSHFTFDYEAYGQRDTMDGWLEADDSVTLTPRKPPAPPTAMTKP